MSYALAIVWRERNRFLPAVLAVAFSATLIALQVGLLLGLLAVASRPIDATRADLWVGSSRMPSLGFGQPIPEAWWTRVTLQPEVAQVEPLLFGFTVWNRPDGGSELCHVIGIRLEDDALGLLREITPEIRSRLAEPGTVAVDASSSNFFGLTQGEGEVAEIARRRIRVVGLLKGVKTIGLIPGVFCSLRTARELLPTAFSDAEQTTYLLARLHRPQDADALAQRLRTQYPTMSVLTRSEFSWRTRWHWLTKTKAGIHFGFCALLGLVVGAVVTSQTLYAATVAALRELALLAALGISRRRIAWMVVAQSFWVGVAGVSVGLVVIEGADRLLGILGLDVLLPLWLLLATACLTLLMALLSGLFALRSLHLVEPIVLLR